MAENGTTSSSQSIDSRESGRPHDQGHDSRETDQVRTSLELARITLHRLEPTCTSNISYISSQKLSQLKRTQPTAFSITDSQRMGGNVTTIETRIDDSPEPFTSNSVDETAKRSSNAVNA